MEEKNIEKNSLDQVIAIQETFAKWGKYMFYYDPRKQEIRPSEYAVHCKGAAEVLTDLEHNFLIDKVFEKEKFLKLFTEIDQGKTSVSARIQACESDLVYQVSLRTVRQDAQGNPLCAVGLVERMQEDTRQNEIIRALGSNFNSVYYVDVDNDKVYTYKVNSAVRSMLNDTIQAIPGYEDIMAEYVGKIVLAEDRETMLYETSLENLRK